MAHTGPHAPLETMPSGGTLLLSLQAAFRPFPHNILGHRHQWFKRSWLASWDLVAGHVSVVLWHWDNVVLGPVLCRAPSAPQYCAMILHGSLKDKRMPHMILKNTQVLRSLFQTESYAIHHHSKDVDRAWLPSSDALSPARPPQAPCNSSSSLPISSWPSTYCSWVTLYLTLYESLVSSLVVRARGFSESKMALILPISRDIREEYTDGEIYSIPWILQGKKNANRQQSTLLRNPKPVLINI